MELKGKTLGIIGMGRIGQSVAIKAQNGFGMNVIYTSRSKAKKVDLCFKRYALKNLLEISDIFVVNKADRPGSEKICTSLKNLISHSTSKDEWSPLVCMTEAIRANGVDELFELIASHKEFLDKTELRQENDTRQYRKYIDELLIREFQETFWSKSRVDILNNELSKDNKNRKSPYDLYQILNSNEQG